MRGDTRAAARVHVGYACPEADCDSTDHTLYSEYPARATSGAWGKYLNPVYLCQGCLKAHTLLCFETDPDEELTFGPYPPNTNPYRHLSKREQMREMAADVDDLEVEKLERQP